MRLGSRTVLAGFLFLSVFFQTVGVYAGAKDEFRIRAGDVLQITVWKEDGLDREVLVLPDGSVTFPLIGTVSLKDLTLPSAEELFREKLSKKIPAAAVTVMVKAPLGHTISVVGQVAKPGDLVMARQMTVMQALSQAGGLTPFADRGSIVVLRQKGETKTSIDYPYNDIANGRHLETDVDLEPGDVVVVPTDGLF